MGNEQGDQSGRRGLFTVNQVEKTETPVSYTQEDLARIVSLISVQDQGSVFDIPEVFTPILQMFQDNREELRSKDAELQEITRELSEKLIDKDTMLQELNRELELIKTEQNEIKVQHESYLADLISAHTEFDRALEIFQYHIIPMVLLGPERQVQDANDAFCTLFSVERSEITRQFPLFTRYVPDEVPFTAPDNHRYYLITVQPPIVPFDHEAVSLELLIPAPDIPEETITDIENATRRSCPPYLLSALSEVPLPLGVVDEHNTVQFANSTLITLLGREQEHVLLRDIGSCGFEPAIIDSLHTISGQETPSNLNSSITLLDGTICQVYVQFIPLRCDEQPYTAFIVLPDEQEEELQEKQTLPPDQEDQVVRTLLDINPSPIVLYDDKGKIILANECISELIGAASDQLTGQSLQDIGVRIPERKPGSPDIEVLSQEICIESPFGIQKYSGLRITDFVGSTGRILLVLQPALEEETPALTGNHESTVDTHEIEPALNAENESSPHGNFDIHSIPVPVVFIRESVITDMNDAFRAWGGFSSDEQIRDISPTISSHLHQAIEFPDQIFSSVFPSGMKKYRVYPGERVTLPDHESGWIIDLTDLMEKTWELENSLVNLQKEVVSTRNQIQTKEEETSRIIADGISNQLDIVEFELSGSRYAIDIGMVREVVEMMPITPLPKTPPYIIGIINLRGEVTHVIDLAILMGEGLKKDRTGQKIIIVPPDSAHGEHIGIIVDNVRSVTEIGIKQVTSLGEDINNRIQTNIKGIIKVTQDDLLDKREGEEGRNHLVIWLDMKEILARLAGFH